jgi:hypothetical protein
LFDLLSRIGQQGGNIGWKRVGVEIKFDFDEPHDVLARRSGFPA